jgi:hypothetical protein
LQAVGGLGQQGTTPAEQLEMDRLWAAVPMGEMCTFVDLECVVNHTLHCASECANQVAFYYELCVARFLRRNATGPSARGGALARGARNAQLAPVKPRPIRAVPLCRC